MRSGAGAHSLSPLHHGFPRELRDRNCTVGIAVAPVHRSTKNLAEEPALNINIRCLALEVRSGPAASRT